MTKQLINLLNFRQWLIVLAALLATPLRAWADSLVPPTLENYGASEGSDYIAVRLDTIRLENPLATEYFYTIDYADEALEDVGETKIEIPMTNAATVTLLGPGTLTAYAKYDGATSAAAKAVLYGLASTTATATLGIDETVGMPAIVPTIDTLAWKISYSASYAENEVVSISEDGVVTPVNAGEATIYVNLQQIESSDDDPMILNSDGYVGEVALTVNPLPTYPIWVNNTQVTQLNMLDVIGSGWVAYNGKGTVILNNCTRSVSIETSTGENMTLYLKGDNTIASFTGKADKLTITTDPANPGTLSVEGSASGEPPFNGFENVELAGGLTWLSGSAQSSTASIGTAIKAVVEQKTVEQPSADDLDPEKVADTEKVTSDIPGDPTIIINKVVDQVLYTLTVKDAEGDIGVVEAVGEKTAIVLNTAVTVEDVEAALATEPGTEAFAQAFEGVTFKLAAGSGKIVLDVDIPEGAVLNVKIGDTTPVSIEHTVGEVTIPYVLTEATFVYIYNATPAASTSRNHRAKVKSTPVRMYSVAVTPEVVQAEVTPEVEAVPSKPLTTEAVTAADTSEGEFVLNDATITTLDDNLFDGMDLKSIDLTKTSITGFKVDRKNGAFKGVSEKTFIYMPAGNTAPDEPNVIIGGICSNMQLADDDQQFSPAINFGVTAATLSREFINGQTSTVYLPFDLDKSAADALGTFFTFEGITEEGEANLKAVNTGLTANTPYIFQKTEGGKITVKSVTVKKVDTPVSSTLIGTYKPLTFTSTMIAEAGSDHYYGFAAAEQGNNIKAGEFVQVGAGATIKPYRAYLKTSSSKARIIVKIGNDQTTGIVSVGLPDKANGWYTIGGTRLQGAPLKPGLYIYNGKKTIVNPVNK